MARRYDIVTDSDIQAYVDGAVHGFRRRAIERHLSSSNSRLERAAELLRLNADLRLLKSAIYRDPDLKEIVRSLLGGRRKRRSGGHR
jgi:anti-sigma factor RsiW